MSRMRRLGLLALFGASACSRAVSDPREVRVNQQVSLTPGESARIESSPVVITLRSVNDSRCPSDVTCVTAGEALNVLQLSGMGDARTDTLRINKEPKSTTYGGYRIEVTAVDPYPVSTNIGATKTVTLLIRQ